MYDFSWSKVAGYPSSTFFFITVSALLGACSPGIAPYNNTASTAYGYGVDGPVGSITPSRPMPQQQFSGNKLAANRGAIAQRPAHVYQPASPAYRNPDYRMTPYAAQPQYVAQHRPYDRTRYAPYPNQQARPGVLSSRAVRNVVRGRSPITAKQPMAANRDGKIITVRWGDTLYAIGRAHGINIRDLQIANNIQGSYVKVGRKLFIPAIGSHHRLPSTQPTGPRRGVAVARYRASDLR